MIAGVLHLWFYTFSAQGTRLKYDPRPLMVKGRQFTLGGQIRDNMFWTLGSGVFFWTFYEVLMLWALGNGWMPMLTWAANPVWFVAIFLLVPLWESFYFYWIHRMIHIPFLSHTFPTFSFRIPGGAYVARTIVVAVTSISLPAGPVMVSPARLPSSCGAFSFPG